MRILQLAIILSITSVFNAIGKDAKKIRLKDLAPRNVVKPMALDLKKDKPQPSKDSQVICSDPNSQSFQVGNCKNHRATFVRDPDTTNLKTTIK